MVIGANRLVSRGMGSGEWGGVKPSIVYYVYTCRKSSIQKVLSNLGLFLYIILSPGLPEYRHGVLNKLLSFAISR